MNNLQADVTSYLETLGYSFVEQSGGFMVADKTGFGGTRDTFLVWVPSFPEAEEDYPQIERILLSDFDKHSRRYPKAKRWLVADTFGGLSATFRAEAERLSINLRVPIQFFDTPFKADGSSTATKSAIDDLRMPIPRIPQAFSVLQNGESQENGGDLLAHLRSEIHFSEHASLRIIVGPAGAGKTWLFRDLFSGTYDYFLDQKKRLEMFPRPIPLVPEFLRRRGTTIRTQDVVRAFVETELESFIPQSTFEWMLARGYVTWMFDGLDELYMGDPEFFTYLADLLTRPNSKAQILICSRESLLSSSVAFSDFLSDFPPGISTEPAIELYRLNRWEYQSKRTYASLHLDEPQQSEFLGYISRTESLRSLSSLPFYCNLLLEEYKRGNTEEFSDDFALISHTVSKMISREEDTKQLLSQNNLQPNGLFEWLETVASDFYASNYKGINTTDALTYAELVLNPDLSDAERQNTLAALIQFPVFAPGAEAGVVTFEHELIAEYLVGRYWLRRLVADPGSFARKLSSRVDFVDSLMGRYIAHEIPSQPAGISNIVRSLREDALPGKEFTVLLQLLLLAVPARDVLVANKINLEGRDLSQVRFVDRDLTSFSFRNCDLSGTLFHGCNLQKAKLEGAFIAGTRFAQLSEESLQEALFGNMERFEFAYIGQRRIEDRSKFHEWTQKVTYNIEPIQNPCATALQVRTLFLKFVHPDGTGRRSDMSAAVVSRGKHYSGAPSADSCFDACVSSGYLQKVDWHDRVKRVPGERYDDMVDYVKEWKVSDRMKEMLDKLCPNRGCEHVPSSYQAHEDDDE